MQDYHGNPLVKGQVVTIETMLRPVQGKIISDAPDKYGSIKYRLLEPITIGMRPTLPVGKILETNMAYINQ